MKALHTLVAFNRGLVSRLALARIDIARIGLSAERMVNWMPRVLGSMMLRPGLKWLHSTRSDAAVVHLPFVFATDDSALIELTDSAMRVVISDAVVTRVAVSSAVTNGTFNTDVTGWTDSDEAGGTSAWLTGGYLSLTGDGTNEARRDQQITVAAGDQNKEHALAIHVQRGTLILSVGSSAGGGQYWDRVALRQGYHSIAFTPTGNFHIRLAASAVAPVLVDSIIVEASGAMVVTTPWAAANLQDVRFEQSGDVVFVACPGHQQRRIERQGTRSWSVVNYLANGPWRAQNLTTITITPSGLTGAITLTASKALFDAGHVGSGFRLQSTGQTVTATLTGEDQFTSTIRVSGTGTGRDFGLTINGTFTATITLQRSLGEPGTWTDVDNLTIPVAQTRNDSLDNQIAYYRLGIKAGNYTSGSASVALTYAAGSILGVARVTAFTSATVVTADVEVALGAATATSTWWEGAWSDYRGWPTAVTLHDGRMFWAGKDRIDGSVSDDFANYDDEVEGDSGPIFRNLGAGPVDTINWLLSLPQLLIGTQGTELVAKASSLEEPLTPSAFSLKPVSSIGSSNVRALKLDASGVYVGRGGSRVYELAFDAAGYNYASNDLTGLVPDVGEPSLVRVAVQRLPDTRIHCVRSDGTAAVLIFDRFEKVTCWTEVETDGNIEDVVVLPGDVEDSVYYVVKRTINSLTKRYTEKWALESEARGAAMTILVDSALTYSGASTATITGLSHLEGETVFAWGNSKDLGSYTVASGSITLSEAVTQAYIGLEYTAQWKSAKLAVASQAQAPLTQRKRIDHLGLILADTHALGLRYGQSFDALDDLPLYDKGALVGADTIHEAFDSDSVEVNGTWDTDARLCLEASSPRPCTVLACVIGMAGHDK